ncbi:putative quinol monooxygenase [Liquorilactobacillus hordei]|uniref:ABM domain-containing protein n=1 Tax=Liquorilactobacillus hordei DSM 19519 TaxID=1423759 RepID=A0A0R1MF44_9LACO|nr:putative quinol monooxygenase [Liquorilactobacillus hordei]KRL03909.1 hypothetical protein FC92_GL001811 [Liquorilactobacillus hordei DSM 19519]QYH51413.1 antibiotic biosynthesis monooxygenase [Liquorilactobacillus hordei DSM 19519]
MVIINVLLKVIPEKREEYLTYVENLVNKSLQDEGNVFYSHFEDVYQKNQFMIVENWANQAAVEAHNKTDHLQDFLKNIGTYLVEDCKINVAVTDTEG